jgi:uncharacterized protein YutE (UPF0331/DUF86 family)
MSTKARAIIVAKLARLAEYLGYLKELGRFAEDRFIKDYRLYGLAERYLQLSIEIVIDISRQLLIVLDVERPESNTEMFEILVERKVISRKLYEKLRLMVGFRNILVHDYMKIDRRVVYKALKDELRDIEQFKRAVNKKLK